MAAISNTLATFLKPGDRVVSIKDSYGGTNVIFNEFLPPLNIEVSLCETGDYEQLEADIAKGCKILYLETPTNPTIKITDIKRLSVAAKKVGALVVVDNTFATPINQTHYCWVLTLLFILPQNILVVMLMLLAGLSVAIKTSLKKFIITVKLMEQRLLLWMLIAS